MGYEEVRADVDQHTLNQGVLGLPSRKIAKIFLFRLIYGGTIFHKDPLFMEVSPKKAFWDEIIERFYNKYKGLHRWHNHLFDTVVRTGQWTNPTGRIYTFNRVTNPWTNQPEWPRTQILNYPVQGLAADTMSIVRASLFRRLKEAGMIPGPVLLVATVHDSILLDIPDEMCEFISRELQKVFDDMPANFERLFGVPFDLPYRCAITYGPNKKDMTKWVDPQNSPPNSSTI